MANILEFLRGVLTDGETQAAYRADPLGFLDRAGFSDLTGEDVVEAVVVLRRSLPAQTAEALAPFESEDDLPAVRPAHEESELDAAARLLSFAVDRAPAAVPVGAGAGGGEATADGQGATDTSNGDGGGDGDAGIGEAPSPGEHEHEREHEHEAISVESELDTDAAIGAPEGVATPTGDLSGLPSVAAFSSSLAEIAADTRARCDDAVSRFTTDAEAHAQDVSVRFTELLRQAERDASDIRAVAETDSARLRDEAGHDREAARVVLEQARSESESMLQQAREESEELRRQGDEILAAARSEADTTRREIERHKAEIREAELQLKERLTGIDSLFRTVLRDENGTPTESP